MQERYAGKAGPRCPGESECSLFQAAAEVSDLADDGQPWGKRHVCQGCELRATKPPQASLIAETAEVAEVVQEVEYLADTQAAGFRLKARDLEPLIYELLILWARYREMAQLQQQESLLLLALTPRV